MESFVSSAKSGKRDGGIRVQRNEVWSLPVYSVKEMVPVG
jgi:hypothetical protein